MTSHGKESRKLPDSEYKAIFRLDAPPPEDWDYHSVKPDVSDWRDVARWVHWFYKADFAEDYWANYQSVIDSAIASDALESLEVLWAGVYYHDRDNPDYETDLLTAARTGGEETFLYALYARRNYATLNGYDNSDFEEFVACIEANPALTGWWGDQANQRAMYDLLGDTTPISGDSSDDSEDRYAPLEGENLLGAIGEAHEEGRPRTARILEGWASEPRLPPEAK